MSPETQANGGGITRRLGMSATRFTATVAYVGIVAAIAAVVTVELSLQLWTMFIGWTCFATGAGRLRRGAAAFACLVIGVFLGVGSVAVLAAISPALGSLALPVVIFLLAAIAMMSLLAPPLDSIAGYFLGMTAFYASGLPPGGPALAAILPAALIGAISAALLVVGPRLYDRWRDSSKIDAV
jgi:hypothetical protein